MISFVGSLLLPLTLMLILLLFIRGSIRRSIDAQTAYRLWLLVPLTLALYALPLPWQQVEYFQDTTVQRFLVQPTQGLTPELLNNSALQFGLTGLWIIGFMMLGVYWLLSHLQLNQDLKLKTLNDSALSVYRTKLPANLAIAQSSHIYSPVLTGLFKQTLVIPENFDQLYSDEQQDLIIAHEVCHFSHNHMLMNQLALLLLALFWFHPLAWRAYASFRQDQEHSCDQFVLACKQTKSRIQYCKALVLAAEISPPNAFTLISFKHNGEQNFMLNRIEQIKTMTKVKTSKLALIGLLSTSLLATVSYAGNQLDKETIVKEIIDVKVISRVEPKYPVKAAKEGVEGSVVLKFDIDGEGGVTHVEVIDGKPAYVFDKVAITALKQWRYQATGNINKNMLVQLDFLLSESSSKPASLIERIKVTQ